MQEILRKETILQSSWKWDVSKEQGDSMTSGVYIYLVTNSKGEKKIGKIAVIK